jgi:hypothetical protein
VTSNPLRDPRDRRIPQVAGPCVLVLFGVTGDLASKKLLPAIYDLANRGLLPPGFSLVGFARRDWVDEDFAKLTHDAVKAHARTPFREAVWRQLNEGVRFVPGEFGDDAAFDNLADTVAQLDAERGTGGNYAFYLSIPPKAFPTVVQQLKRSGLSSAPEPDALGHRPWRRVVIEKPFGHDLASARELNSMLDAVFPQGDGAEPARAALRQHPFRADLESRLRRPCADHHGRGHRHRRAGRILRRHRRGPRRDPESPAAAARPDRDGGAAVVLRRLAARREGEGAVSGQDP